MRKAGDIVYIGKEKYEVIEERSRNAWKKEGLEPEAVPQLLGKGILAWCLDPAGNPHIDVSKMQYFLDIDITEG